MIFMNVDRRGRGTLPDEVRKALGIGKDDSNLIILERTERGTYEMVPAAIIPKDQLWFYHPKMQERIRKAEASLAAGGAATTRTPEEARAFLDGLKRRPGKRHK